MTNLSSLRRLDPAAPPPLRPTFSSQDGIVSKSVAGALGGAEHYIVVTAPPDLDLAAQLDHLQVRYAEAQEALGLAPETAIFRRLFLSDPINQTAAVRNSALFREPADSPAAVSVVGQPPLGSKIALLAHHISGATVHKTKLSPKHLLVEKNGLRHLWSTRICAATHGAPSIADAQTWEVFSDLIGTLTTLGGNLRDHCVRTWLYLKDVDVFYKAMVETRGKLFRQHGLTEDTHYISSTGIQGACSHQYDVVLMDAYSLLDLRPGQMTFLSDLDKLCATKDYQVHFERGTRIAYADRAHYFISGTASIDAAGTVVHPGNVVKQLDRALVNVEALLASGQASLDDMMYLIVYLRDVSDERRVRDILAGRLPGMPTIIVQGPVCRPDWLIEIEGIGVAANVANDLPSF
jgi:enamine deaminase RidA (YjgF/YER057c/UK114 family)